MSRLEFIEELNRQGHKWAPAYECYYRHTRLECEECSRGLGLPLLERKNYYCPEGNRLLKEFLNEAGRSG